MIPHCLAVYCSLKANYLIVRRTHTFASFYKHISHFWANVWVKRNVSFLSWYKLIFLNLSTLIILLVYYFLNFSIAKLRLFYKQPLQFQYALVLRVHALQLLI